MSARRDRRRPGRTRACAAVCFLLLFFGAGRSDSRGPAEQVLVLGDNGQALANPGMGWVFHYYDDKLEEYGRQLRPGDTLSSFPGMAVAYMRLPWAVLEPDKGRFDWELIDRPARHWLQAGKRIAFRFTSSESGEPEFATPQWVKEAGAKGNFFDPAKGVVARSKHWEPDYDDAVFLSELNGFLKAAAARYDGRAGIDFIDVGSFGVWGEGHTLSSSMRPYSSGTIRRIVDLYRQNFLHTQLVCNDDFALQGRGREVIDYCEQNGLTLRDDSILVARGSDAFLSAVLAQKFWPSRPVILESQYYGIPRDAGYWDGGGKYIEAMEAYHASYVSAHWSAYEFLSENAALIARMNRRLGYRLVFEEVTVPVEIRRGGKMHIGYRIRNAGVAPCLPGGKVAFSLRADGSDRSEGIFVDSTFDVKNLTPGATGKSQSENRSFVFDLAKIPAGRYSVWVSIGDLQGHPVFMLPVTQPASGRYYRLSYVRVY